MQIIYTKDNINLNYLNNYVKFSLKGNTLNLYNTLYNKSVNINGSNHILKEFIKSLINGINNQKLLSILESISNEPKELYEYLLQNFIIE